MRKQKIKHRRTIGGYLLDEVMGVRDQERDDKRRELKILEKSRPAEALECGECGRLGCVARCSKRILFHKCDKPVCKNCAKKRDGKYYCRKHI